MYSRNFKANVIFLGGLRTTYRQKMYKYTPLNFYVSWKRSPQTGGLNTDEFYSRSVAN